MQFSIVTDRTNLLYSYYISTSSFLRPRPCLCRLSRVVYALFENLKYFHVKFKLKIGAAVHPWKHNKQNYFEYIMLISIDDVKCFGSLRLDKGIYISLMNTYRYLCIKSFPRRLVNRLGSLNLYSLEGIIRVPAQTFRVATSGDKLCNMLCTCRLFDTVPMCSGNTGWSVSQTRSDDLGVFKCLMGKVFLFKKYHYWGCTNLWYWNKYFYCGVLFVILMWFL